MTLSNSRLAAGVLALAVSFLLASVLCVLFYRSWFKGGKLFGDNTRNDPYLANRSLIAWLGLGVYCIFEMTVARAILVWFIAWRKPLPGGQLALVMFAVADYCVLLAILFVRCWRLRVRHMYYVVLGNADWSKLMDPSVEDSLSFWVKYKALLTSNRGVSAVVLLYTFSVLFLMAVLHNNLTLVRKMFMMIAVVTLLTSPLLLYKIPHNRDCLKVELQMCAAIVAFTMTTTGIIVAVFEGSPVATLINQPLLTLMETSIFLLCFYWFPRRVQHAEDCENALESTRTYTRRKVLNVFKDPSVVMAFAKHCCEHFCVENLLAVLELKAFKGRVRKELTKELKKELVHELSDAGSATIPLVRTLSQGSVSSSASAAANEALYIRATKDRSLGLGEVVSEEWTRWDQTVLVTLSQLGCRSAIVKGAGDARCKALALCSKYFEWDSEFSLNVSYENRSKVLAFVGKDATAKLQSEALLFVFDEAIRDVFANLSNAIDQFESHP